MSHYLLKSGDCSKACPACDRIRTEAAAEEREAIWLAIESRYAGTDDESAIDILKLIRARGEPPKEAK